MQGKLYNENRILRLKRGVMVADRKRKASKVLERFQDVTMRVLYLQNQRIDPNRYQLEQLFVTLHTDSKQQYKAFWHIHRSSRTTSHVSV